MNFYKHYIGDFQRDTGHLSLTERGAYLALMHHYYATEQPLPANHRALCRIAGAITKAEQTAVKAVMSFFNISDSGLIQYRIEAEIEKAGEVSTVNKKIAIEREEKRRIARKNNDLDVNAKHEACTKRSTNVARTEHEQSTHQTPDTKEQEHEPKGSSASAVADAPARKSDTIPYQAIVDLYNASLTALPKVRELTAKRRTLIRAAWQASPARRSRKFWTAYFAECQDDDFLNGTGPYREPHANWRPDFDYLLTEKTITRTYERALDRIEREAQAA